jgi:hypothetical protein
MLAAVAIARTMIAEGRTEASFPMLDRDKLWDVTVRAEKLANVTTPAGTFLCREVKLLTARPPGEPDGDEKFKGLFGIHGTIKIWLHGETGVPVLIHGDVPLGPWDVSVDVSLRSYSGTPPAFSPR